jgi:uncharacterized protein YqeY
VFIIEHTPSKEKHAKIQVPYFNSQASQTMTIHQTIKAHTKEAMIAKDTEKTTVLRSVSAAFQSDLIAKKSNATEVTDDEALVILKKLVKQRKDSIEQFTNGGRPELAECEKYELGILEKYLPSAMPKAEIEKIATDLKAKLGITDKTKMGQLMGAVIKETKGKADGADVKEVVEKLLA